MLLVLTNPNTGDSVSYLNVTKYSLSKNGNLCAFIQVMGDSIDSVQVSYFNTTKKKYINVFNNAGNSDNIEIDEQGKQFAFTYSSDTLKEKAYGLYYYNAPKSKLLNISGVSFSKLKDGWSVSNNGKIYFNKPGTELYFGTAIKPEVPLKDTLTDDEKVSIDIWNWKDIKIQPQQLKQLESEKKRSYVAVYYPKNEQVIQLADEKVKTVSINPKSDWKFSLGYDYTPYQRMTSWEASRYRDIYLVDRQTGFKNLVLSKVASIVNMSPRQDYIVWYSIADSSWYSYDIGKEESVILTNGINVNYYNELNDIPNEANSYGFAGWTKDGSSVMYDCYDLWKFDPSGRNQPINLTQGEGRKNDIRFRYVKLDKDLQYLPDILMLSAFNKANKSDGFYSQDIKGNNLPVKIIMEDYDFISPIKSKHANKLIWKKQSFDVFPDLYVSRVR